MILNKKIFLNFIPHHHLAGDFETITTQSKAFKDPKYFDPITRTFKYPITAFCLTPFDPNQDLPEQPNHFLGTSVLEMFATLADNYPNKNLTIFFHNLKGFDGYVIIDAIRHSFKLISAEQFNFENPFVQLQAQNYPGWYNYMLKDNHFLLIDVYLPKSNTSIRFQCSLRLLTLPIAALGKALKYPKQTTDYNIEPQTTIDLYPQQYIDYLKTDTIILAKSLINFFQQVNVINQELNTSINPLQITAGSLTRSFVKALDPNKQFHKIKAGHNEIAQKYYFGGFSAVNNNYLDKPTKAKLKIFDAKSFYPTIMSLYQLPSNQISIIDPPQPLDAFKTITKLNDETFIQVQFPTTPQPKTGWAPFRDNNPTDLQYRHTTTPNQLSHWNGTVREFKAILPFYHFQSNPLITQIVQPKFLHQKLKPYIDTLYRFKENSTTPLTFKILLNSTYGSLALDDYNDFSAVFEEPDLKRFNQAQKEQNWSNLMWLLWELKNGEQRKNYYSINNFSYKWQPHQFHDYANFKMNQWVPKRQKDKSIKFLPLKRAKWWNKWIPAFITSYCRAILFELISIDPESVVYCDTDSMFLKEDSKIIDHLYANNLVGFNLGQWDQEEHPPIHSFHILAPKSYTMFGENDEVIKLGMKGVDKTAVYNLLSENPTFLIENTTIPEGQKFSIIKFHPDNFDEDGNIIKTGQPYLKADSYYPFIIKKDKSLIKIAKIRKETNNEINNQ